MFLFGFGQASSLLARFAAADVSTADQRAGAIGLIVGGATAGSIIGRPDGAGHDAGGEPGAARPRAGRS